MRDEDLRSFAMQWTLRKAFSHAFQMMFTDTPVSTDIFEATAFFISCIVMGIDCPMRWMTDEGDAELYQAREFLELVNEHRSMTAGSFSTAIQFILLGIEDSVPRKLWTARMRELTVREIERIAIADLPDETVDRILNRIALFFANNNHSRVDFELLDATIKAYKQHKESRYEV